MPPTQAPPAARRSPSPWPEIRSGPGNPPTRPSEPAPPSSRSAPSPASISSPPGPPWISSSPAPAPTRVPSRPWASAITRRSLPAPRSMVRCRASGSDSQTAIRGLPARMGAARAEQRAGGPSGSSGFPVAGSVVDAKGVAAGPAEERERARAGGRGVDQDPGAAGGARRPHESPGGKAAAAVAARCRRRRQLPGLAPADEDVVERRALQGLELRSRSLPSPIARPRRSEALTPGGRISWPGPCCARDRGEEGADVPGPGPPIIRSQP